MLAPSRSANILRICAASLPMMLVVGCVVAPDAAARYTCGADPAFSLAALQQVADAELGNDPAAVLLRQHVMGVDGEGLPDRGWRRVADADGATLFLAEAPPGAEEPYVQVLIGPLAGELRPDRWGACIPQVVLGGGAVAAPWNLDRGQAPVGPDTRRLEIGVLERSCASGHSAEGRIAPPTVDYLTDTVVIVIGVVPRPGGQDCQGNPVTPFVVELSEPLGERRLLDGSTFPLRDPAQPFP